MTEPTKKPRRSADNARWPDRTRTQRSARRTAALNAKAKELGFDSWRKLETALLSDAIKISVVENEGNEKLQAKLTAKPLDTLYNV